MGKFTQHWAVDYDVRIVRLIPGYGTLVSGGIGALAALWAWFRSSKNGATAATLAQSIS